MSARDRGWKVKVPLETLPMALLKIPDVSLRFSVAWVVWWDFAEKLGRGPFWRAMLDGRLVRVPTDDEIEQALVGLGYDTKQAHRKARTRDSGGMMVDGIRCWMVGWDGSGSRFGTDRTDPSASLRASRTDRTEEEGAGCCVPAVRGGGGGWGECVVRGV